MTYHYGSHVETQLVYQRLKSRNSALREVIKVYTVSLPFHVYLLVILLNDKNILFLGIFQFCFLIFTVSVNMLQNLISRRLLKGVRQGLGCLSTQASVELGTHHHVSLPADFLSPEEQMMKETGTIY